MPFCTQCGASVTGAFCSQCGTPAAGASAQAPAVPGAPPVARKTSPVVWVLVIVLGFFVLGGVGAIGLAALVAHHARRAGISFDRGRDGGFALETRGADGKRATLEFGASSGKLPSWVPAYPGSHPAFTVRAAADGGEGGNFTFKTSDDVSRVKSFYIDKCQFLGMKLNLESTTADAGMIVAVDEGGDGRSLTVVVGSQSGETTVNVTYGRK
jgi:hypothetical protein